MKKRKIIDMIAGLIIVCVMVSMGTALKIMSANDYRPPEEIKAETSENEKTAQKEVEKEEDESGSTKNTLEEEVKVEKKDFVQAPEGYFEDALFIGDSRTVGIEEYGQIEGATFFATSGMSVYNIYSEIVNSPDGVRMDFESMLNNKKYGKVYLMLGINELGYSLDATVSKYGGLLDTIRTAQPEAIVFVQANMHVSKSRSDSDKIFNNYNIDKFNERISKFADGKSVFYLDVNPIFDDDGGNLSDEFTSDNSHVMGKYYVVWRDWLMTKAIV